MDVLTPTDMDRIAWFKTCLSLCIHLELSTGFVRLNFLSGQDMGQDLLEVSVNNELCPWNPYDVF